VPPPLHDAPPHVWPLDVQSWHAAPKVPQRVSDVGVMQVSPSQQPRHVVAQPLPPPSSGGCPDDALVEPGPPPAPGLLLAPAPLATPSTSALPVAQAGLRRTTPSKRRAALAS
jgi:hypothetical protein